MAQIFFPDISDLTDDLEGYGEETCQLLQNEIVEAPTETFSDQDYFLNKGELFELPVTRDSPLCDMQNVGDENDCVNSSCKVTTVDTCNIVNTDGLPQTVTVPGPPPSTEVDEASDDILSNNNNNESEIVCETFDVSNKLSIKYKCVYCRKVFNKLYNLKIHLRCHTGEQPFQCLICGRSFSQVSNAKRHISTHKVWPKALKTKPKNLFNSNKTDNEDELLNEEILSFSCLYCPSKFKSYKEFQVHRRQHSSHKVFKCSEKLCRATFNDIDSFIRHNESHRSIYSCHLCHKEFTDLQVLNKHQSEHNRQEKIHLSFSCPKCFVKFKNKHFYEKHLLEDAHRHECPHCPNIFLSGRLLRRHIEHHTSKRRPCLMCGKRFNTNKGLYSHFMNSHFNENRYNCNVCQASFKRKDNFIRHNLKHSNSEKFKCPYSRAGCCKTFARRDIFKNHLKVMHGMKSSHCLVCKTPLVLEETDGKKYKMKCACLLQDNNDVGGYEGIGSCSSVEEVPTIEIVVMPMSEGDEAADEATFKVLLPNRPGSPQPTYTIKPFKP